MSAYLTLAGVSTYTLRAGGACAVLNNRVTGASVFASPRLKALAEKRLIQVGLRAVEILAKKDKGAPAGKPGLPKTDPWPLAPDP
jgi:hypothetical protein